MIDPDVHRSRRERLMPALRRERHLPRLTAPLLVLAGVALLPSGTSMAGYIGTSVPASLEWECTNGVFFHERVSGTTWWAGEAPAPTGPLRTRPPQAGPFQPRERADGIVSFLSGDAALFTSEAGGTVRLERQTDKWSTMGCGIGTLEP